MSLESASEVDGPPSRLTLAVIAGDGTLFRRAAVGWKLEHRTGTKEAVFRVLAGVGRVYDGTRSLRTDNLQALQLARFNCGRNDMASCGYEGILAIDQRALETPRCEDENVPESFRLLVCARITVEICCMVSPIRALDIFPVANVPHSGEAKI